MSNPLWFKDAIIYQLHVKTFQDSDGDGVGDFRGLLQRIDHFTELGVTAVWLLPFYPSPLRDDGYDIADYFSVNPAYGTLDDFREFLDEAHKRDLRVITELVMNHSSDQCSWFQRARRAPEGSAERDFYVWTQDPKKYRDARIIFKDFESSNWSWDPLAKAYYWHRFYSHQPDLNFDNPVVHETMLKVTDFWLGMGVDGIRLDAVPYLYEREGTNCENLPETHAFLKQLRAHIDANYQDRMLLAEANMWPEDAAAYFGDGDECHMNFHFPLMPRLFMSLQMEDRYPIIDILEQTPEIPKNCQWATFLRNHDELTLEMVTDEERDYMYRMYAQDQRARINLGIRRRLAPLLGNNRRKIELINSLLFSLPGTPIIYYGDEIGMGDNFYLGDRNGVRTPMQWSPDRNAGFSKANPQQLFLPVIIDPEYHYETVNVENQQRNLSSLFWWMRRLLSVQRRHKPLTRGDIKFLQPANAKVLVFLRTYGEEKILVVANLSRFAQSVEVDLEQYAGLIPEELFGRSRFPRIKKTPMQLTLGPHGFYWLALRAPETARAGKPAWEPKPLQLPPEWSRTLWQALEREVLPAYLPTCRWFGGKGRIVRDMNIIRNIPLNGDTSRLLLIEVSYTEGLPDHYLLPVAFAEGDTASRLETNSKHGVLARLDSGEILCDALLLEVFRIAFLRRFLDQTSPLETPRLAGHLGPGIDPAEITRTLESTRVLGVEQSNTSIICDEAWFVKFFRKFEFGPQPDAEITRLLSANEHFSNSPRYAGELNLVDKAGQGTVALMVGMVQNQGDGWAFTLDALGRYFDRVLEQQSPPTEENTDAIIGGVYPERARQLGQRTAEMHLALASAADNPHFAVEEFSTHYQRSLYQGMRAAAARTLRDLELQLKQLPASTRAAASEVLAMQGRIVAAFARLTGHRIEAARIRIHGDYHLGQVLNTGKDFVIIDFEGEPKLSLSERMLKRCPLRDVAGMLRSFDYAATAAMRRERGHDQDLLEPWADIWVTQICRHYLQAYLETAGSGSILPTAKEDLALMLEIFLLNKVIYEIGYELSYRPDFLPIPLRAAKRIIAGEGGGVRNWIQS